MKVAIGEGCEKRTWQDPFEKETACVYCGGNAELAFVAYEGLDGISKQSDEKNFRFHYDINDQPLICSLKRQTGKPGGFWLHDCVSVAVFFCRDCLKPTAQYNQG